MNDNNDEIQVLSTRQLAEASGGIQWQGHRQSTNVIDARGVSVANQGRVTAAVGALVAVLGAIF